MEQLRNLTKKQKARLISLILIVAYLLYGALAYAREVRMQTPQIDYVDSMQIDGSEFAPIANLFVMGANGLVGFLTMILSVAAMLVIALILLLPWRLIAIRQHSDVTEIEYKIAKYLLIGFAVLSVGIGLILLRFTNLIYILSLSGITVLLVWLLSVRPIKNAYLRSRKQQEEERES